MVARCGLPRYGRARRGPMPAVARWIVSNTGTVSLRLSGFSQRYCGVQFIPSMSRTRKATHRPGLKWFPAGLPETLSTDLERTFIMNKTARFLSLAALAAFASFGAQADEADSSQFATQFQTSRTRAEVQAEAATVPATRSLEPAGSRVVTYKSTADRAAVRAQAAEALRTGQIPTGEFSTM